VALQSSLKVFNMLGLWGIGFGIAFIALSFFIKGWAHGADDHAPAPQPEPIAPTLDGERQAVSPAAIQADRP